MGKKLWNADQIIYADNPKKTALNYISEHFDTITPFEVSNTYSFQIRVNRTEAEKLSAQTLRTLIRHSEPLTENGDFVKDETVPNWEYFWKHCNCYIFNITTKQAVHLHTKCVYGYEGREESYNILFFPKHEFPPLIVKNMGLDEREKFKR